MGSTYCHWPFPGTGCNKPFCFVHRYPTVGSASQIKKQRELNGTRDVEESVDTAQCACDNNAELVCDYCCRDVQQCECEDEEDVRCMACGRFA